MRKSLFAVVLLAAGVSFANAQSTEKAKKLKGEKAVKTEVQTVVNAEAAAAVLPAEPTEMKATEQTAVKTETAAELKQEETTEKPAAKKPESM